MGTGTGSGLIGLGVVLAVVGAIMRYAIEANPTGFDVVTTGASCCWWECLRSSSD